MFAQIERESDPVVTTLVRRGVHPAADALVAAGLPAVLARIYAARGITTATELDHTLRALPPFAGLRGIDDAAVVTTYTNMNKNLVNPRVTGWVDNIENWHRARWLCVKSGAPRSSPTGGGGL